MMVRKWLRVVVAISLTAGCGGSDGDGATNTTPPLNGGGTLPSGCKIFPADNPWNRDVSGDPVDPNSDAYIAHMGPSNKVHPDFGSDITSGIPYILVPGTEPRIAVTFDYASESDPGPYPIPLNAPIEGQGASDRHVLAVDTDACKLYELYDAHPGATSWHAGSGAIFDLKSNALRHDGYTSADAAGLPIFPGLVRYDEAVTAGVIKHALRFTMDQTQNAYVNPATHSASTSTDTDDPPMGLRVRMKASYDISKFTGTAKVVAVALKTYGMFLADNGSNWYISGEENAKWNDDDLDQLKAVKGGDAFEVVKLGTVIKGED